MYGPLGTRRLSRRRFSLPQLKVGTLAQSPAHGLWATVSQLLIPPCLVANQKAKYMVKKLNKMIKDQEHTKPFEFHNLGSMAYLGDWYVLGKFPNPLLNDPFDDNAHRKAIYDRSTAETGFKTKESGRLAWLLWRSAYFTMTLSVRNKYVHERCPRTACSLDPPFHLARRILVPTYWCVSRCLPCPTIGSHSSYPGSLTVGIRYCRRFRRDRD